MMQLLVNGGPLQHLLRRLLLQLRGRWRHDDEQRDENCRRCSEQFSNFIIIFIISRNRIPVDH